MNILCRAFACGLLLSLAPLSPVVATEAAPQPQASEAAVVVTGKKEKKVCKTVVATGSIMPKRVCRTESQIAEEAALAQRALDAGRQSQETAEQTRILREAK